MTFCSVVALLAVVPFWTAHEVSFSNGAQFPGAKGAIDVAGDELRLDYDFSGGGHYVAAECALGERPSGGVSFRADVPDDVWLSVRFVDSDGQTFVKNLRGGTDGLEPFEVRFDGKGPRWAHWGGKNDGVVRPPVVSLAFGAENRMKPLKGGGRGTVRLADVRFSAGGPEPAAAFDENLCASVAKAVGRLEERYGKSAAKGAKTRAVIAVANDFLGWIRDDLAHGRTDRAARETKELERLLRTEAKRLAAVAAGEERDFPRTAGGFRLGFGHFEQVISEMERLEPLGQDIVQVEFGPAQVFPSEGVVSTNGLSRFFRAAEKAQRLGMKVCLLLSPHYFPQWALEKCPELKPCGDGMLHYCVHHPFARDLLKRYFELVVPLVKDHPALHSLCLSNEPVMSAWDDRCALQPRWTAWLKGRYADVAAMNAKWGTSYAAFEDCRLPRNFYAFGPSSPQALEMTRFNREAFAEFHAWMAGIVRGLAPGVPLHSKIMIHANFTEGTSFHCVDPELFATWSDLGGNDCMDYVTPGNPTWAHDFGPMEAGYDYLRSVSRAPVFNSENHIIDDGETREIPAGHVYSSLWQNMIHGQEGTTIWYWERAFSRGAMCEGLFLDRPTALAATAFAALDLNRLSKQVKAIAARKPTVLLHWSLSSLVLDKRDGAAFLHAYRAASCLGQPLGVATERMLAAYAADGVRRGALEDVRAVILPDSSHLPDKVRAGLAKLAAEGVPVVVCGRRPSLSDFNEPRDGDQFGFLGKFGERDLADRFFARAKDWKLPDYPRAVAADGGAPFGVESNGVVLDGVRHLSLVNHRNASVRIRLPFAGIDLVSGRSLPEELTLEPLSPVLLSEF